MRNYVYPSVKHVMEVTEFKTKEMAEAAIKTLRWLDGNENLPKRILKTNIKFDMSLYIRNEDCGTTCCIAGSIKLFMEKKLVDSVYINSDFKAIYPGGPTGLSPELDDLFYVNPYNNYIKVISKFEASQTLRKYLKTGIVDWSHLNSKTLKKRYLKYVRSLEN